MEHPVQLAVSAIYERYDEPLCLDELARTAMVSKFHFVRMFRRVTGVTPGRFLSAVRLQAAKRLLQGTSFNVADIAARVGYTSTGTFTRRFTDLVGLPPTQYRAVSRRGDMVTLPAYLSPAASSPDGAESTDRGASISGVIETDAPLRSDLYIGVFDGPLPQGWPAACTVIPGPGPFRVSGIPAGTWYLHALALGSHESGTPYIEQPLSGETVGPLTIDAGTHLRRDVSLCPLSWAHPPVLFALPVLNPLPTAA